MKPIRLRAAPDFDLQEWAELLRTDPAAFEARRQSLIVIELARAGSASGPAKRLLRALDACDEPRKVNTLVNLSTGVMGESTRAMNRSFAALEEQMRQIAARRGDGSPPMTGQALR